jgi:hypothetical protein
MYVWELIGQSIIGYRSLTAQETVCPFINTTVAWNIETHAGWHYIDLSRSYCGIN